MEITTKIISVVLLSLTFMSENNENSRIVQSRLALPRKVKISAKPRHKRSSARAPESQDHAVNDVQWAERSCGGGMGGGRNEQHDGDKLRPQG